MCSREGNVGAFAMSRGEARNPIVFIKHMVPRAISAARDDRSSSIIFVARYG
jgi:hypothetical protein